MEVERTVRAAFPHDCPDTCAMHIMDRNGVALRVRGDADHPTPHGALGTKVSRYTERTYHPERVLHPLKCTGPKGCGRFTRVTWDEVLSDIAARLTTIAARVPEAIVNERAPPGVVNGLGIWCRKLGLNGRNVNELTPLTLTDLGAAPAFYDCLVEVQKL